MLSECVPHNSLNLDYQRQVLQFCWCESGCVGDGVVDRNLQFETKYTEGTWKSIGARERPPEESSCVGFNEVVTSGDSADAQPGLWSSLPHSLFCNLMKPLTSPHLPVRREGDLLEE